AGLPVARAARGHRLPSTRSAIHCIPRHALRRGDRRDPRPGPLPRPRAGTRLELQRAPRRAGPAEPEEHLQGAGTGRGLSAGSTRVSPAVGAAGRLSPQLCADSESGATWQSLGALGALHRQGDRGAERARRAGGVRAVGAARAREGPPDRHGPPPRRGINAPEPHERGVWLLWIAAIYPNQWVSGGPGVPQHRLAAPRLEIPQWSP